MIKVDDPTGIRLCQMDVILLANDGENRAPAADGGEIRAARWTLGPEWYEIAVEDEDIVPYCPTVDGDLLTTDSNMRAAQAWAASILRRTSNYRVVRWVDQLTPRLTYCAHTVRISTVNPTITHVVTSEDPSNLLRLIKDRDSVLTVRGNVIQHGDGVTKDQTDVYIPMWNVTHVEHTKNTTLVS